ncbi:hypothetical protein [Romboutsia sp. Marseille-P6047]|uniref:hypothetical protein n=1 Tax=Romboutsia sp. Marseille-P6047 TaxID=2161817 RepID=UPI000F063F93|nr:hypothetical protein [Romboutsia sp. Marseille-P6047]
MSAILGLIVGTVIFFLINESVNITYFGCGAIASFWFTCVLLTTAGFMLLGGFVLGLLKWLVIGGVILAIIGFIGSKINGNEE